MLTIEAPRAAAATRTFLHVGCGRQNKWKTTPGFATDSWNEIRYDIDEGVAPDVIGTITDMSAVPDASVDAIFSAHNVEHLYPHEVPVAFAEFLRVLKPDGFAVITCPDVQSLGTLIAEDKLTDTAYVSPSGPITPLDILFGHRGAMQAGNLYMAHHCAFTMKTLTQSLAAAGFAVVAAARREAPCFDLWALASKSHLENEPLWDLAKRHFPM
jgi:hypothetical protein